MGKRLETCSHASPRGVTNQPRPTSDGPCQDRSPIVNWDFDFEQSRHDLTVTATGGALATEFAELLKALCADERFKTGMLILLDLRTVDLDLVPQMELEKVSDGLAAFQDKCEGCSLGIVATLPRAASMFRGADFGGQPDRMRVWIAWTVDEASAWLENRHALQV
jgi:hypothetical protein